MARSGAARGMGFSISPRLSGRTHLVEVEIGLPREVENDRIVRALLEDERGILWVGAGSGLYAREPEGRVTRLTVAEGLPANEVLASGARCTRQIAGGDPGGAGSARS